jgi:single-strand DNA-binding protein
MAVKGELQSRSYTANDGSKRTLFEVVVDGAFFCESKQAEPSAEFTDAMASVNIERDEPKQDDFEEIITDEQLPF